MLAHMLKIDLIVHENMGKVESCWSVGDKW